jgi:hypothetical protein
MANRPIDEGVAEQLAERVRARPLALLIAAGAGYALARVVGRRRGSWRWG